MPKFILITHQKGGVGKSTLAFNLASNIKEVTKTCIIDMDYQGSLVLVSHDRHLLRNTVDEFYLVHDKQVEEFKGDLADYQKWLNEQNAQPVVIKAQNEPSENENSAANRKEQKRKEAELRQQLAPLRKQATQLENQMEKLGTKLQQIETALADPSLYDAEMKAKLTALLAEQVQVKKQLEEVEVDWLALQESIEDIMSQAE